MSDPFVNASRLLKKVHGKRLDFQARIQNAIELATYLLEDTQHETSLSERKRERKLKKMMEDPIGKAFLTAMTDQCFRSRSNTRSLDQLNYLLNHYGIPSFLGESERMKFLVVKTFGPLFPNFFAPKYKKQLKKEFSHVLLPEEPDQLKLYMEKCKKENIRINLNHLGEAILGEKESTKRLQVYLDDLAFSSIDYISIKISTIFSQIHLIDWEKTLALLAERLRILYRAAMQHKCLLPNGKEAYKFVNLDMEESKDLDLTVALFEQVLSEPEFMSYSGGIVLQSYLPESFTILKQLIDWAEARKKQNGAFIKIRIVKGANLAMEKVEASYKGWAQAPFLHKEEADANFRKMIEYAIQAAPAGAVHIGVGSHNLLDIAYALILRAETQTEEVVNFEMLEGMAEPMRQAVQKLAGEMILYCPEAKEKDFHAAVAYLIRRLDENTGPQNFLRHLFELNSGSSFWENEITFFKKGCTLIQTLPSHKQRNQDRRELPQRKTFEDSFTNEPDTDFSLSQNRMWAHQIYENWRTKQHSPIPLVIGGEYFLEHFETGFDPSQPKTPLYQFATADLKRADEALSCAKRYEKNWASFPTLDKIKILKEAAHLFRSKREDLIGAMMADAGKVLLEADVEVSEAIDFIEYYCNYWEKLQSYPEIHSLPRGTILVAPPWNFPCSIPTGGIAAALLTGNCVLFKPAPETVLVGWVLVQLFWQAGIPKEALQWVNCPDDPVGSALVKDDRLNGIILTGATATARKLFRLRPSLYLAAETGGKNAMIITAMSDRDLAIRDLLQSAFGHAGQKCSACSLAILEAEVYDDPHFLQQLNDAAQSLCVGSQWDPKTKIPPLIRPPEKALKRAFSQLDEGETWLLEPKQLDTYGHLWSLGIKMGVRENSFTHRTELFGPVLGVMRADTLDHAITLANETSYGLTSGLHSLDPREQEHWKKKIVAGNLYINRTITGAIVRRQPFGGCKASSFGPGAKAGGPNYLLQFVHIQQKELPQERGILPPSVLPLFSMLSNLSLTDLEKENVKRSVESYAHWIHVLKEPADPSCILGQDNFFYHVPKEKMVLRVTSDDPLLDLLRICFACLICGTPLEISSSEGLGFKNISGISWLLEDEENFFSRLRSGKIHYLRLVSPPSKKLLQSAAEGGVFPISNPVLASGRVELLHYLREVSLSVDYHRYGYLGLRETN